MLLSGLVFVVSAQADSPEAATPSETVTLVGSFQALLGCAEDWQPACETTQLTNDGEDDLWMGVFDLPAGDYEYKVALNDTWDENYGAAAEADGANIPLSFSEDRTVQFFFDYKTHWITDDVNSVIATAVGTFQMELGCGEDYAADCLRSWLQDEDGNGVYSFVTTEIPAGDYELKVALNQDNANVYGAGGAVDGDAIPFTVEADGYEVTIGFSPSRNLINVRVKDPNAVEPTPEPTPVPAASDFEGVVTAPGSYQSEIGCPDTLGVGGDWEPPCLLSELKDEDGDGIFTLVVGSIPQGTYELKIAINQTWSENYGADGAKDGPNIPLEVPVDYAQVTFNWDAVTKTLEVSVDESVIGGPAVIEPVETVPDVSKQRAHWVDADTIAWNLRDIPADATFNLYYAPEGGLAGNAGGFTGGTSISLTYDEAGLSADVLAKFPHLEGYAAFKISADDSDIVPGILKSQMGIAAIGADGVALDGTGIQIPGVLDDLYAYDGPLGVTYEGDVPTLRVWAPTAQRVRLRLFDDANPDTEAETVRMEQDRATGVWSVTGDASWTGKYYLYDVRVYAPSVGEIVSNQVTDPYSFSLSLNSARSQIVNLNDPALKPEGWDELAKPELAAPEDIVIYELHIRDFSANDMTVPEELRGTFKAFTLPDTDGMKHLIALAEAGLTHLHLLPAFDIATIDEDKANWQNPDPAELAEFAPDSEEQQAAINAVRDQDAFNWGYDPYHYTVPEGSYATNANDTARILEFREMVKSLNENGLRVVMDVVYNHTNAWGQSDRSVLDKIVPGYYYRLNENGVVYTSTCCPNTATEHHMMEKLMIDSVLTWVTEYKVDSFRFDLMGHHMRANMEKLRAALDALTVENSGVDGTAIYVYGEGWNFGEVENGARGVNATQLNMGGVGIGTFNDRLRDAVRGGTPFGDREFQGFITDLFLNPNGITAGTPDEQKVRLLLFADQIRTGLAGNLRDYSFIGASGETITGGDVLYGVAPVGYTLDPQEQIVYISKHDNETLWDIIQYKQLDVPVSEMVRMHNLGNSIVLLSQGVPFFQAGDDLLRSKSLDRNSYNSGDWFNRLDFTYQTNNWGVGLPMAGDNQERWPIMQPLLANPSLAPTPDDIMSASMHFREMLQIRASSPLFRLHTAADVQEHLAFLNTGPDQIPGLIVMALSDDGETDLDPANEMVVVLFNATGEEISFTDAELAGMGFALHPVLAASHDSIVQTSAYDAEAGAFTVPARTTAVFIVPEG